jgi:CRISPR-associated protein Cmr6
MNALLPIDTRELLSKHQSLPDGRSLFFDRFAPPGAKDEERRDWFQIVIAKPALRGKVDAWAGAIERLTSSLVYAQLQSRLMVNMAGGVMENAGLCLDRFGMPYIPGSAVKGCARRMATKRLMEADTAQAKTEMLVNMALVFGWGDTDWRPGRRTKRKDGQVVESEPRSDFWWAMADDEGDHSADSRRSELWSEVARMAAGELLDHLQIRGRKHGSEPWLDLPNFAGCVGFLPAQAVDAIGADLPLRQPALGTLEMDIVTCHHRDYYEGKRPLANDDEDPNPVVFPSVAAGHVFAFALAPLRNRSVDLLQQAREWLVDALSVFGLGAKTAAGYGWFETSETVQTAVKSVLDNRAQNERAEVRRKLEREAVEEAERIRIARKRELDVMRESMSEEDRQDFELDQMDGNQRIQWMEKIDQRTEHQKLGVYRLLRSRNPELWKELRHKAEQGKQRERQRFGPLVQEMFKLAKQRKEKMP